jgi:hypothetical protein
MMTGVVMQAFVGGFLNGFGTVVGIALALWLLLALIGLALIGALAG